jgi:cadmium resistance protein CadD (predicted permease)
MAGVEQLASNLGVAVVVFVSTNVDDIVLLSLLFADPALKPRSVIIGQFLGIAALIAVSGVAGAASLAVPEGYVALLGAAPLVLGLKKLWELKSPEDSGDDEAQIRSRPTQSSRSGVMTVTLVTIANGGDNLGVYVPLFARDPGVIVVYSVVFAIMTAIWCGAGLVLVNHPALGERVRQHGRVALPLVLIVLGVWILGGARTLVFP